ncbi:hypothetical protein [Dyella sp. C9]|nr:hypothetical protein [Dyella sp. C9]
MTTVLVGLLAAGTLVAEIAIAHHLEQRWLLARMRQQPPSD